MTLDERRRLDRQRRDAAHEQARLDRRRERIAERRGGICVECDEPDCITRRGTGPHGRAYLYCSKCNINFELDPPRLNLRMAWPKTRTHNYFGIRLDIWDVFLAEVCR